MAQIHRLKSGFNQALDLSIEPTSFGSNGEGNGLCGITRTRVCGSRVGDKREGVFHQCRQFIFNKGFEKPRQTQFRKNRVFGLF